MQVALDWKVGMSFSGKADSGFTLDVSADADIGGAEDGFRPMELVALGLAACTGMDVISVLQKKRQEVSAFEVRVHTEKADDHPRVWTHVTIEYLVTGKAIDPAAVERAMQLSYDKYCPAQNMLKLAVKIDHKYTIIEG